jgi:hypothetical protein
MLACDLLIALRADEENGEVAKAATDNTQHVECRIVGPMQVLEDNDPRCGARLPQQCKERLENSITVSGVERFLQRAIHLGRDVCERGERASRQDRVARTPQDPHVNGPTLAEGIHYSRLADARFTGDKHKASSPLLAFDQQVRELVEKALPFQELHPLIVLWRAGAKCSPMRAEAERISVALDCRHHW